MFFVNVGRLGKRWKKTWFSSQKIVACQWQLTCKQDQWQGTEEPGWRQRCICCQQKFLPMANQCLRLAHVFLKTGKSKEHRIGDTKRKESWSSLVNRPIQNCLVVWTPLKNISQLGWLFPIYGKIKNVPNHQPGNRVRGYHRIPEDLAMIESRKKQLGTKWAHLRIYI